MKDFRLHILRQYWIDSDPNNYTDLCSHGEIYLRINSQEILTEADHDWTISTSTLLLLRTIFHDYNPGDESPLILHCGMLLMLSCPISATWSVAHREKKVFISKVRKNPTTNINDTIEFPKASMSLELREYAMPILKCAEEVAKFFRKGKKRKYSNDFDKNDYDKFWKEFNKLKLKAKDIIGN